MTISLSILDMQELAKSRGGRCVSPTYHGITVKLLWECSEGHLWWAQPNSIKNSKSWCPHCNHNAPLTVEQMDLLAAEHGGAFLEISYRGSNEKHRWRCSKNHLWSARPHELRGKGSWCPHCASKAPYTLVELDLLASSRGGKCLEVTYRGVHAKHRWLCAQGHQWEARPKSLKERNTWCPACAGNAKLTVREFDEIASKYAGRFLEVGYRGIFVHHTWQCAEGHTWSATPSYIRNHRKWCPVCRGQEPNLESADLKLQERQSSEG